MKRSRGTRLFIWSLPLTLVFGAACSGRVENLGGKKSATDGGGTNSGATGGGTDSGAAGGGTDSGATGGRTNSGATGGGTDSGAAGGSVGSTTPGLKSTHKLDLLLVVDNSSSMTDKQDVLTAAMPDIVTRITAQGSGITDLHVGVITTSLGDHGAGGTCPVAGASALVVEENDDHALLLGTRPRAASLDIPSGFVSWTTGQSASTVTAKVQGLVGAADQQGCGFEATLEAMYRFLADPTPPETILLVPCPGDPSSQCAASTGIDMTLLAERAAFLRPDSAVAIVVLSDENDCSIRDEQQSYLAAKLNYTVANGTDPCATNPNDPCCYNCALGAPAGSNCPPPSSYAACQPNAPLQDTNARFNLRCWDEKARFGVDLLYPVERYVNALSRQEICTSSDDLDPASCPAASLVQNPLFSDLSGNGAKVRDPSLVFLLTIVGVPWQDIQATADPSGNPYPATELHWKTPSVLAADGSWPLILGDPAAAIPATDPLMIESPSPRSGFR